MRKDLDKQKTFNVPRRYRTGVSILGKIKDVNDPNETFTFRENLETTVTRALRFLETGTAGKASSSSGPLNLSAMDSPGQEKDEEKDEEKKEAEDEENDEDK